MRCSLALFAFVLAACEPVLPGESVGAFDVVGALRSNTCGSAALPAIDPLVFFAEIRADGNRAWWRRPDATRSGIVMPDGAYRFTFASLVRVLPADRTVEYPGCMLEQHELLEARVVIDASAPDAGAPPDAGGEAPIPAAALSGVNTIELAPAAGSDCRPLLGVYGGPWAALPCGLDYALSGASRAPF